MAEYRLYCLDGGGRIQRRHDFVAVDDQGAIDSARGYDPDATCELWSGSRKVATLHAGRDPIFA